MISEKKPAIPELEAQLRKFVLYVGEHPKDCPIYVQTLVGSKTHPGIMMLLVAAPDDMIEEILHHMRRGVEEMFRERGLKSLRVQ